MTDTALAHRDGLPEALRVLVEAYPREGWSNDPGFDGLIRFWLDRHMMFRRLLTEMNTITESALDTKMPADRYAAQLSRYGGMFVNGLHEHHTIEDTYYFPKLVEKDARISRGFDILDADHHALDTFLSDFVTAANETIARHEKPAAFTNAAGAMHDELAKLTGLLDRHLVDEEDLVVPIILKYGAPELG